MRSRLKVIRFPVASPVFDFIILGNNSDFGDRVARVEMPPGTHFTCCTGTKVQILTQLWPPALTNPLNKSLAEKLGYTGSLCIARPDGAEGFAPKWNVEFFTGKQAIRRAILGAVVLKSVRDDRRSPTSGEVLSLLALLVQKYKY